MKNPAKKLLNKTTKNPLGIISLFIAMVYATTSLVISFAQPIFYENPYHPAVIFLAAFPIAVLISFTYLVIKHHTKLYSPNDFTDQDNFFRTPQARLLPPPLDVPKNMSDLISSDKSPQKTDPETAEIISSLYKETIDHGYCLVHQAEVIQARHAPRTGQYKIRAWIESFERKETLSNIKSVTYHAWTDFSNPIISTTSEKSNFDIWISAYGEFPLIAIIKTSTGKTFELQRYLDLPGRPSD